MGGGVEGRLKKEGISIYIKLVHATIQQKLTQNSKAIILHKKKRIALLNASTLDICVIILKNSVNNANHNYAA